MIKTQIQSRLPLALFILIFITVGIGQYATKKGAMLLQSEGLSAAIWFIVVGYTCLFVRGIIWMIMMKTVKLSYAYPVTAISFVLVSVIGLIFFGEQLSMAKLAGLGILLVGVYLSMMSK